MVHGDKEKKEKENGRKSGKTKFKNDDDLYKCEFCGLASEMFECSWYTLLGRFRNVACAPKRFEKIGDLVEHVSENHKRK